MTEHDGDGELHRRWHWPTDGERRDGDAYSTEREASGCCSMAAITQGLADSAAATLPDTGADEGTGGRERRPRRCRRCPRFPCRSDRPGSRRLAMPAISCRRVEHVGSAPGHHRDQHVTASASWRRLGDALYRARPRPKATNASAPWRLTVVHGEHGTGSDGWRHRPAHPAEAGEPDARHRRSTRSPFDPPRAWLQSIVSHRPLPAQGPSPSQRPQARRLAGMATRSCIRLHEMLECATTAITGGDRGSGATVAIRTFGPNNVDWEVRVDMDRLRRERLGRLHSVLEASELGALLCFDFANIRYATATHIGTWAIDKLIRFALITRGGDPIVWDFGSARHHQLHNPWLDPPRSWWWWSCAGHQGGVRGAWFAAVVDVAWAIPPGAGMADDVAAKVFEVLAGGPQHEPVGIDIAEMPVLTALADRGLRWWTVSRCSSRRGVSRRSMRSRC